MSEQKTIHRRRSKLDPYIELLGIKSDAEIAALAGVTPANVNAFRRRHGIPMATATEPATEPATKPATPSEVKEALPSLGEPLVMSEPEYRAAPGLNFSTLKHLATSPKAYKYNLDAPKTEPTAAQTLGTAIHMAVLEPEKFWNTYAIREKVDGRTKEGKEYNAKWEAENPGKVAIDQSTANTINAAVNAVADDLGARALADGFGVEVHYEVPIFWDDPLFGACKGRPDVIRWDGYKLTVLDLKTTSQRPDIHTAARLMGEWLVPLQLAFYARAALTKLGLPVDDFSIVDLKCTFVQTVGPFDAVTYTVSSPSKFTTLDMLEELGSLLSACQKTNVWLGLPTNVEIDVPAYYLRVK